MLNQEVTKKVSYITEGTIIKGDVSTSSALIVKGTVEGNVTSCDDVEVRGNVTGGIQADNVNISGCNISGDIKCTGNLFVDKASSIDGNVTANQIKVSGQLKGQVNVNKTAEFLASSVVIGDIHAESIAIEHGARIKGYVDIHGEEEVVAPQPTVAEPVVETPVYEPVFEQPVVETAPFYEEVKDSESVATAAEPVVELTDDSDDALFEELK